MKLDKNSKIVRILALGMAGAMVLSAIAVAIVYIVGV